MATAAISLYSSSIGKKVVMAVTGFIIFGFVTVHMLGNLQIFAGPETLNGYAAFLKGLGSLLWIFRGVMLLAIVLHIVSSTQLTLQSMAARPQGYAVQRYRETTYAARTMRWGGPILGLFIIYHLLHLTVGTLHPTAANFSGTDVYNNVVLGFQVPLVAGIYIAAVLLLGLHLYHGVWSMFQSLGISHWRFDKWRRVLAVVFAVAITLGNISIPIAVLAGVIKPAVL